MRFRSRTGALLGALLVLVLAGLAPAALEYDALQTAANNGDAAAFKKLLAKSPGTPRVKGAKYLASLMVCAAWGGSPEIARTVLGLGAKPASKDETGQTAIGAAAYQGRKAVVELLLARGVSPNTHGLLGSTPLHDASYGDTPAHLAIVSLLLARGATINVANSFGVTPLQIAVQDENL